jgi:hypothetical protein
MLIINLVKERNKKKGFDNLPVPTAGHERRVRPGKVVVQALAKLMSGRPPTLKTSRKDKMTASTVPD